MMTQIKLPWRKESRESSKFVEKESGLRRFCGRNGKKNKPDNETRDRFDVLSAIMIALACSMAMSLPISTPPNAIAFATEVVETKDLIRYRRFISLIGMLVMWTFLLMAHSFLGLD